MTVRFAGKSRISARIVTDLPQPDSPMMHSTSPGITSNDTPFTARTVSSRVTNLTVRSWTSTSGRVASGVRARLVLAVCDKAVLLLKRARRRSGVARAVAGIPRRGYGRSPDRPCDRRRDARRDRLYLQAAEPGTRKALR